MIFLYTINNTDRVASISSTRRCGFVMKRLSPPSVQARPLGSVRLLRPPPLFIPRHPPVPLSKFARNPSGLRRGWTDHVSYPPGERGHRSYESQLSYEKHCGGVLWLPDEHSRCTFMLLARCWSQDLACQELEMQRGCQFQSLNEQCSWQNNTLIVKEKWSLQEVNWL